MTSETRQRRTIPALYFTNRLVSQAGQGAFVAALFLMAGQQSSAAVGLSGVLVAMMAGALIFALPGGALVDAVGGGRGLFMGAAGRACAIAAALFAGDSVIAVSAIALGYSAVSQVFSPSELALVSAIGRRHPPGTHAALVALQHGGQGIGMLILAPVLFWLGGTALMLAVALGLYAAVVALSGTLNVLLGPVRAIERATEALSVRSTIGFYRSNGVAANAGMLLGFVEMATKAAVVALPIYVAQELHLGTIEALALGIPAGAGALAGLAWAGRAMRLEQAPQVMRWTLAGASVGLIALAGLGSMLAGAAGVLAIAPFGYMDDPVRVSVLVAIPAAVLLGLCFAVVPICTRSVLSAVAPAGQQARVFASQALLTDLLSLAPLLLAGVGTELYGARVTFLATGIAGVGLFVAVELIRSASLARPVMEHAAQLTTQGSHPER